MKKYLILALFLTLSSPVFAGGSRKADVVNFGNRTVSVKEYCYNNKLFLITYTELKKDSNYSSYGGRGIGIGVGTSITQVTGYKGSHTKCNF